MCHEKAIYGLNFQDVSSKSYIVIFSSKKYILRNIVNR